MQRIVLGWMVVTLKDLDPFISLLSGRKSPTLQGTYPLAVGTFEYDFPFPVGYVSLLEGDSVQKEVTFSSCFEDEVVEIDPENGPLLWTGPVAQWTNPGFGVKNF